jgi:hypothetical protein
MDTELIMMKKTAFGITGVAAAALLTIGAATPAFATGVGDHHGSDGSQSYSSSTTSSSKSFDVRTADYTYELQNWTPIVVAPTVNVGDVASGDLSGNEVGNDVANGNSFANGNSVGSNDPIASGNTTTAPIASGNTTPVASGNDTTVSGNAVGSGNTDNLLSGDSISTMVENTTSDIGNTVGNTVSSTLNSISGGRW